VVYYEFGVIRPVIDRLLVKDVLGRNYIVQVMDKDLGLLLQVIGTFITYDIGVLF